MRLDSETWDRWVGWMERIEEDLRKKVLYCHALHERFAGVVRGNLEHINSHGGGSFCEWVRYGYGTVAAMGVRRQTKNRNDSISLARLVHQIHDCADQFTYEFYLERFPLQEGVFFDWQRDVFDDFSEDSQRMSQEVISRDLEALNGLNANVGAYVDSVLAHDDKDGAKAEPSYGEIDDAVNALNKMACKYIVLLTSRGAQSLEVDVDVPRIFRVPLDVRKTDYPRI